MKYQVILWLISIAIVSCQNADSSIEGSYDLKVEGLKNVEKGILEIVGESDDYFGKIVFLSKKPRTYALGLQYQDKDSLSFQLPGNGGYLNLKKTGEQWKGKFKYFGIKAIISGKLVGTVANELMALKALKPIGKEIISTRMEETFPSYDAKDKALYFSRAGKIYSSQEINASWTKPKIISFAGDFMDSAPYLSPDGQSLIFSSNRPIPNTEFRKKNLWVSKRAGSNWSKPYYLPAPVNIDSLGDYHGGISNENRYYFVSYNREGGFGRSDIYSATLDKNGTATNLGNTINTAFSEADVFIDPDERFILFASTNRRDSYGADDIYISYKEGKTWSNPLNLGPKVNSFAYDYGAWVDKKNGFFYFNSFRRGSSDIYRIKLDELEVFNRLKN